MPNSPMQELIVDQLRDLYDAEKQLTKALPKLAKSANDDELARGFQEHLEQTKGHVQRIERVFESLGMNAKGKPCEAMKGLVKEGQEAIDEEFEEPVGDIALISAARRVEHYEMAAYETLILAFQATKQTEAARLLQETLKEENETDKKLTTMAKRLMKGGGKSQSEPKEEINADNTARIPTPKKAKNSTASAGASATPPSATRPYDTTDHEGAG